MVIKDIKTKIILDSRGEETLETQIDVDNFSVEASVPSGKSRGIHEATPQKPNIAINKLANIKSEIVNKDFINQEAFDGSLIKLDGTDNKANLGANLILSLSMAYARANAKVDNIPLWKYINNEFTDKYGACNVSVPHLVFNVINGGAHSSPSNEWIKRNGKQKLSIQEFQIIPMVDDTAIAFGMGKELYRKLNDRLVDKFGRENIETGDEAGFIAPFKGNEDALEELYELIEKNKYPARIGIDVASSQLFKNEEYEFNGEYYSKLQATEYYRKIINRYNLISIEDPFDENDFQSFSDFTKIELKDNPNELIVTDDLTTTNPERVKKAVDMKSGNALLVKPNQIGTITETLKTISIAYASGWKTVTSHRSGETLDDFIADLAVGIGSWGIKAGAPATPFRIVKYDRLVEIYKESQPSSI